MSDDEIKLLSQVPFSFMDSWSDEERREWQERIEDDNKKEHQRKVNSALHDLDVPERYKHFTFSDYKTENPNQKSILSKCNAIVNRFDSFRKSGTTVLMCGNTGTGKTMLAYIIAMDLARRLLPVELITAQKAIRRVRATFGTRESEQDVIDHFSKSWFLILDEIGVALNSEYEKGVLFEIINERYNRVLPTILTSNLNEEELRNYLGPRIMRRFKDSNGLKLVFDWKEYERITEA